jgi:hypothetical protein
MTDYKMKQAGKERWSDSTFLKSSAEKLSDVKVSSSSVLDPFDSLLPCIHLKQIPHNLYKPEGYEHKEALFGMPPYGGSIAQNVYYVNADLCGDLVDNTKGYPERENNAPWPSPFIVMIDRGNCTFTKKVSHDVVERIACVTHSVEPMSSGNSK